MIDVEVGVRHAADRRSGHQRHPDGRERGGGAQQRLVRRRRLETAADGRDVHDPFVARNLDRYRCVRLRSWCHGRPRAVQRSPSYTFTKPSVDMIEL
jgi:hypothetical protein